MERISELISKLTPDPLRSTVPCTPEFSEVQQRLFEADDAEASELLTRWLARHQPCLFGRIAAKKKLISLCILNDRDLLKDDEAIEAKIQAARTEWTRAGFKGEKNGFIVLALSKQIAEAAPDDALLNFATRLASLYLLDEVKPEGIFLDEIFLRRPDEHQSTWKWHAGVNVFAAAGDGRWWQDHRIPGGLGFSVNSVGHMVRSSMLADASAQMDEAFGEAAQPFAQEAIDSLPKALEFAMRTIAGASEAVSGKATFLYPAEKMKAVAPCPIELPPNLADRDYCEYGGYYHTDVTIPLEYFRPDIDRPPSQSEFHLDFTYLFNQSVDNPAFRTMGAGRRIRDGNSSATKLKKAEVEVVPINSQTRLARILRDK